MKWKDNLFYVGCHGDSWTTIGIILMELWKAEKVCGALFSTHRKSWFIVITIKLFFFKFKGRFLHLSKSARNQTVHYGLSSHYSLALKHIRHTVGQTSKHFTNQDVFSLKFPFSNLSLDADVNSSLLQKNLHLLQI